MEDIRYSEDVKDVIALANRMARKEKRASCNDRDYLHGLLLIHRKFNRLDSLMTEMNIPLAPLRAALSRPPLEAAPSSTRLLAEAETLAHQHVHETEAHPHPAKPIPTVEVEHLLKALCLSPDPWVQQVMRDQNISPERIELAVTAAKARHVQRAVLYVSKELLEVVLFVLFFLILIKSFLGELRLIPSESMLPGLKIDDRLVIERVTRWNRPYHRGDILVFYPPMTELKNDPGSLFMRLTGFSGLMYKKDDNIDVAYIKRLIGLPGDIVNVKPGAGVFVNGKKLDEPYVNEIAETCTLMRPEPYCGSVKVPPHHYYMMGDNRNLSLDSRYWGFADEDRVIGRAVFRIWPPNRIGTLPIPPEQ